MMRCLLIACLLVSAGCGDTSDEESANNGAVNNGAANNGAANNGPANNGPANNGPANNGPANNGPANNGPANNGPANNGPANNGPANNGPANNGPANNGPANNGPANNGPANNGPANNGAGDGFGEVFQIVFVEQGCTAGYCHGAGQGGFLAQDEDTTWTNLVDAAATVPGCDLTQRVVPGDPDSSILWHRVRPSSMDEGEPCFPKMPSGSDGLSQEHAQLIYDWIAAGAM